MLKQNTNSFNVLSSREKFAEDSEHWLSLPQDETPSVLIGDVFDALRKIPSKSISVVVTSPPYWNLRDYETTDQIGTERHPAEYVQKITDVGDEIMRILKDDGAYFLNIGDTYCDKNLQMIPQRVAIGMQQKGWLLRNQIIWYKPNHMPSPVKSRFTNTYEPIFFFTKNDWEKNVYLNMDAVRVPHKMSLPQNSEKMLMADQKVKDKNRTQDSLDFFEGQKKNQYNGKFANQTKNLGASPGARVSVNGDQWTIYRDIQVSQNKMADYLKEALVKNKLTIAELITKMDKKEYQHKAGHWFRTDAGGSYPGKKDWMKLKNILKFDNTYDKQMTVEYKKRQDVSAHPKGKNPGDLFVCPVANTPYKHFAIYPKQIPRLAITACCPENGIVPDPFAGSGTTGIISLESPLWKCGDGVF